VFHVCWAVWGRYRGLVLQPTGARRPHEVSLCWQILEGQRPTYGVFSFHIQSLAVVQSLLTPIWHSQPILPILYVAFLKFTASSRSSAPPSSSPKCFIFSHRLTLCSIPRCLGSVVVTASDSWSRGREFNSRSVHCRVAYVNSAFPPSGVGKSSTSLLAGVKAGWVHLCLVAGNTVWSIWQVTSRSCEMGVPLTAIHCFFYSFTNLLT